MSTSEPTPPVAPAPRAAEDCTVAILAYLTVVGFIIALILYSSNKTAIGAFHLRQALGLLLTALVGYVVLLLIPVVGWLCIPLFGVVILVFAVLGIIAAANGQQKPLPLLGEKYQQWFSKAFT